MDKIDIIIKLLEDDLTPHVLMDDESEDLLVNLAWKVGVLTNMVETAKKHLEWYKEVK